jgi:ABC-type iron transport system FetAB ATPase subunit
MLTVRGLTRPGLGPLDLELGSGEVLAVLGPSGSGKTMLLRAIADLDPSHGFVALDGRRREEMPAPEWRRQVTYMAAEPAWWAETPGEHFADADKAARLLPALGLEAAAMGALVANLSTGERQRLALARVLALAPPVMLLDEPTSALDAEAARAVEAVLRERLRSGATILVVTHDEDQIRRLGGRRLRLAGGAVAEAAS